MKTVERRQKGDFRFAILDLSIKSAIGNRKLEIWEASLNSATGGG